MKNETKNSAPEVLRTGAAYIRVSTDDQLDCSPDSQLAEIQAYCQRNNIILVPEYVFVEQEGRSGRKSQNRLSFQRMIATAKLNPRPFDVIVCWKFSRFARNQDESTFYKSMLRKKYGIDVLSVSEPLIEGMYGRLIEMIIEWQDEFYSVNLSAEVTRSMRFRAEKGMYNGKVPIGYHREPGGVAVIYEPEAQIVRKIYDLFLSGYDRNYVVREINSLGYRTRTGKLFDSDGVTYILQNPFYVGKIRWNYRVSSSNCKRTDPSEWIIADSFHAPLIDKESWELVQKKIALVQQTHDAYAHPVSHGKHWLSGLVKCPICGKSLSYKHSKTGGNSFQCLGYRRGLHKESQCISERKLTAAVLSSLHSVLTASDISFDLVRSSGRDDDLDKQIYLNELAGLDRKEKRIKEAFLNEIDTLEEYRANKSLLQKRRDELNALLSAIGRDPVAPKNCRALFLSQVDSVIKVLESDADYALKGESLRSIVQRIVFYKNTGTLEFHYYLSI